MDATDITLLLTAAGLVVSVIFSYQGMRIAKQESVANTFIELNARLQRVLYSLLEKDHDALSHSAPETLGSLKFSFYEMFDIFADMIHFQKLLKDYEPELWTICDARITALAKKKNVYHFWNKWKQQQKYTDTFMKAMNKKFQDVQSESPREDA